MDHHLQHQLHRCAVTEQIVFRGALSYSLVVYRMLLYFFWKIDRENIRIASDAQVSLENVEEEPAIFRPKWFERTPSIFKRPINFAGNAPLSLDFPDDEEDRNRP
ncbi:uncharacterized protein LOC125501667 [Athalia rosae]|uniref:uncharacterized protein LOC125501667 n=1 Tax=Athalia rosae TaxID=37344 RepID=UPI002034550E|nr:uncharacterized protein LOC125501667 [Athalia rosae]